MSRFSRRRRASSRRVRVGRAVGESVGRVLEDAFAYASEGCAVWEFEPLGSVNCRTPPSAPGRVDRGEVGQDDNCGTLSPVGDRPELCRLAVRHMTHSFYSWLRAPNHKLTSRGLPAP